MSIHDQPSPQRRQLAQELRSLREAARLSGMELARRTGISQSKVSRIEHAQQLPSASDLDRWTEATSGAPAPPGLVELREQAATESVTWRRELRRGLTAIQAEVKATEAAATLRREYHPVIVPGLLQAPAYARATAAARYGPGAPEIAEWMAGVVDRQALLYEQGHQFEFLIGEAALRWSPGPADLMRGQLDRVGVIAGLDNVTMAILPFDRPVPMWHSHAFTMFEGGGQAMVHLELLTGGQNLRDPDDVARFSQAFKALLDVAAVDEDARAVLGRVAEGLQ